MEENRRTGKKLFKKELKRYVAGFILLAAAAGMLLWGVSKVVNTANFIAGAQRMTTYVSRIEEGSTWVNIGTGGEYGQVRLPDYSFHQYRIGEAVELYVQLGQPFEARLCSNVYVWDGIVLAVGAVLRRKRLMETGQVIYAPVTGCSPIQGKTTTYEIYCRYRDPRTGQELHFESRPLKFDPRPYLSSGALPVYIEQEKSARSRVPLYAVDTSLITQRYLQYRQIEDGI